MEREVLSTLELMIERILRRARGLEEGLDAHTVVAMLGDVRAVVQLYSPDALEVEFVSASGRAQVILTLRATDVRALRDDEVLAVRSTQFNGAA